MTESFDLDGKSFEELLELLQETVAQLDGNGLTLEQSVVAYERSVAIAAACENILNEAELRIERIHANANGDTPEDVPF